MTRRRRPPCTLEVLELEPDAGRGRFLARSRYLPEHGLYDVWLTHEQIDAPDGELELDRLRGLTGCSRRDAHRLLSAALTASEPPGNSEG